MIYLSSGWAFIIVSLLLATEKVNKTPFIVALIMLMLMFCFRAYLHFQDDHQTEARLDVILSVIFSIASVVLLIDIIPLIFLYFDSLQNIFDPVVIMFLILILVFLLPFAVFSLMTLYGSLKHLRDTKINYRIVR